MKPINKKALSGAATPAQGHSESLHSRSDVQTTLRPHERKHELIVLVLTRGIVIRITGKRLVQTARLLLKTGRTGFTSGEASPFGWARRTSAYVHALRGLGVPIETLRERTPDGMLIGRYRLSEAVMVISQDKERAQ